MARPSQTDPRERALVLALKEARLSRGLSASQLAAQVGLSRTTITNLEADDARPGLWTLLKMADGIGINLADYLQSVYSAEVTNKPKPKK